MAIKNYTTSIDEHKTVAEIQMCLARKGAANIQIQYDGGLPQAVAFCLKVGDSLVPFRLPCNFDGVLKAMSKQFKSAYDQGRKMKDPAFRAQSRRTAWRIVKDWVEAQMAIVEAEQAQLAEVFLPYVVSQSGQTMFQNFLENQQRTLPPASEER
jgi:hypothetical protein